MTAANERAAPALADRRGRLRRSLVALAVGCAIALVATAVVLATRSGPNSSTVNRPRVSGRAVGSPLPVDFTLARLGGGTPIALGAHVAGRPAVINLFASWCTACASELDAFGRVSNAIGDRVAFVGIDTSENDPSRSELLLSQAKIRYPIALDSTSLEVADRWGVVDLPVTFFIRANGTIAREVLGAESASVLRSNVDSLVAKAS